MHAGKSEIAHQVPPGFMPRETMHANDQLTQAVQESSAAFELSQDISQTIVVRARDELHNVPQSNRIRGQMCQDSAALQRRLLVLRSDDLRSAQSLADTLDYLADAEQPLGNIDISLATTDELETLLIDARKQHPNHVHFPSRLVQSSHGTGPVPNLRYDRRASEGLHETNGPSPR
ncbi:MAG: hypothetical protein KGQ60_07035 [Planctomycetes bacterium]|nr:hypothetical protein [Planctomycetota bacterium]